MCCCQAFLTDEFSAAYPEHVGSIDRLKSLIRDQVSIAGDVI